MTGRKTLGTITYTDLAEHPVWAAVGDYAEAEDPELAPLKLDAEDRVPTDAQEVWCLCRVSFSDGSQHRGAAMCRGDSADGPLAWTVYTGSEDVSLILPPAPPFVLAKEGPEVFARKFGRSVKEVFPIHVEVSASFATPPEHRDVWLTETGPVLGPM